MELINPILYVLIGAVLSLIIAPGFAGMADTLKTTLSMLDIYEIIFVLIIGLISVATFLSGIFLCTKGMYLLIW